MAITDETRRIARARKQELRDLSDAQIVALTAAWVSLFDDLVPEYEQAVLNMVASYPNGATRAQLDRDERVLQAMDATRERLDELAAHVNDIISNDLPEVVRMGAATPVDLMRSQLPGGYASLQVQFGSVSEEALAAIVARTTGTIHAKTLPLTVDMEDAMKRALTQGIVDGANPREVARRILYDVEGEFNGGLARASTLARSEMLDANRAAHQASSLENADLVTAQVWQATLDARTCMSCLEQHGEEFPPDSFGPLDHPNGRCTFIVKLKTWAELGIHGVEEPPDATEDAQAWFNNLTEDTQRAMLGPGKYELWQAGEIGWGDFSVRQENDDWRPYYVERPLKAMR